MPKLPAHSKLTGLLNEILKSISNNENCDSLIAKSISLIDKDKTIVTVGDYDFIKKVYQRANKKSEWKMPEKLNELIDKIEKASPKAWKDEFFAQPPVLKKKKMALHCLLMLSTQGKLIQSSN